MKRKNLFQRYYQKSFLPRARKALGMDDLREEIMTLFDSAADITQCRPATGRLRRMQLGDLELLRLFDLLCEKHGLTYWLDWGTMLGAVRHHGFIPWDDDLDVCMPREDYEKMLPILTEYFSGREGFCVSSAETANSRWMWVNYWQASVLIDIFPIDSISIDDDPSDEELQERVSAARNGAVLSGSSNDKNGARAYFYDRGLWWKSEFYRSEKIFPLQRIPFETYELCVPRDVDLFLRSKYGDYMKFPRSGIVHHKGLIENRQFSETALEQVTQQLKEMQKELLAQK